MTDAAATVLLTTLPSPEKAADIARILVEERLAACASVIPQVRSIYRWQGTVQDETETLVLLKTTLVRADALRARLVELHPYDVPEVLALPVTAGHAPYLAWLAGAVA